ncbi:MAG: hypothetical protein U0236_10305 [Nitrospira sp.]
MMTVRKGIPVNQEDQFGEAPAGVPREHEPSDKEIMDFDRLVFLADTDGLVRMGLGLIEAFARAEGRILWH